MQKRELKPDEKLRIKEKEQKLLEKKIGLVQNKQKQQLEIQSRKEHLLTKQNTRFQNVESKLTEMTLASKDKYRLKFDPTVDKAKYADTFGGNLNHLTRAVPTWRVNM